MNKDLGPEDKYLKAERQRQDHVDAVLKSHSKKKIVVAGPGTGKTYLFKRILEGQKGTLTLTFVNALVEELSLDLCGLSDVRTLHGFARSMLRKASGNDIRIFPKLSEVIRQDARVLLKEEIDFDYLFHNRDDENERIEFYRKRKDYYAYYGYSDIVFAVVKYFEQDKAKIPAYGQVVVDEFQDFNRLEVSLIDLLAEKSPVLLAGDDDQALYESLKSASAEHIRQRHGASKSDYAVFSLPYCSRSTRVVVETANDIIDGATKSGYLKGRIGKPYLYFEDVNKDKESDANPKVIYTQLYAKQIPWFIQRAIEEAAKEVKSKFSVLIISPIRKQSRFIVDTLKTKGFGNIHFMDKRDSEEPTLLDGLKLLLDDSKCNLGWRVVARALIEDAEFEALLAETAKDGAKSISEMVGVGLKKEVSEMLRILRAVRDDKGDIDETRFSHFLKKIDVDPHGMARDFLKDEISSAAAQRDVNPGIRKIPINATTIQSSKGLAAEYVFITHFDDQYFVKNADKTQISDQDICNFLVALTRARRKVFLISSDKKKKPIFLKWVKKERIEQVDFK